MAEVLWIKITKKKHKKREGLKKVERRTEAQRSKGRLQVQKNKMAQQAVH